MTAVPASFSHATFDAIGFSRARSASPNAAAGETRMSRKARPSATGVTDAPRPTSAATAFGSAASTFDRGSAGLPAERGPSVASMTGRSADGSSRSPGRPRTRRRCRSTSAAGLASPTVAGRRPRGGIALGSPGGSQTRRTGRWSRRARAITGPCRRPCKPLRRVEPQPPRRLVVPWHSPQLARGPAERARRTRGLLRHARGASAGARPVPASSTAAAQGALGQVALAVRQRPPEVPGARQHQDVAARSRARERGSRAGPALGQVRGRRREHRPHATAIAVASCRS